jgi:hypothetical protein
MTVSEKLGFIKDFVLDFNEGNVETTFDAFNQRWYVIIIIFSCIFFDLGNYL